MRSWIRWRIASLFNPEQVQSPEQVQYKEIPAFKFQCDMCGLDLIAPVPEPGTLIKLKCRCSHEHRMFWTGKYWQYKEEGKEYIPPPDIAPMTMKQAVDDGISALEKKRDEEESYGAFKPSD